MESESTRRNLPAFQSLPVDSLFNRDFTIGFQSAVTGCLQNESGYRVSLRVKSLLAPEEDKRAKRNTYSVRGR